ncbi:hypothetical protein WDW86_17885 [Bdellovibrionota bacterium FG-2]
MKKYSIFAGLGLIFLMGQAAFAEEAELKAAAETVCKGFAFRGLLEQIRINTAKEAAKSSGQKMNAFPKELEEKATLILNEKMEARSSSDSFSDYQLKRKSKLAHLTDEAALVAVHFMEECLKITLPGIKECSKYLDNDPENTKCIDFHNSKVKPALEKFLGPGSKK